MELFFRFDLCILLNSSLNLTLNVIMCDELYNTDTLSSNIETHRSGISKRDSILNSVSRYIIINLYQKGFNKVRIVSFAVLIVII